MIPALSLSLRARFSHIIDPLCEKICSTGADEVGAQKAYSNRQYHSSRHWHSNVWLNDKLTSALWHCGSLASALKMARPRLLCQGQGQGWDCQIPLPFTTLQQSCDACLEAKVCCLTKCLLMEGTQCLYFFVWWTSQVYSKTPLECLISFYIGTATNRVHLVNGRLRAGMLPRYVTKSTTTT